MTQLLIWAAGRWASPVHVSLLHKNDVLTCLIFERTCLNIVHLKKKKVSLEIKGGNSGKFGCLTNTTSFPPACGFCLLKNFESSVIMTSRCDLQVTERRMNGHVKSVHLQLWMEAAAG